MVDSIVLRGTMTFSSSRITVMPPVLFVVNIMEPMQRRYAATKTTCYVRIWRTPSQGSMYSFHKGRAEPFVQRSDWESLGRSVVEVCWGWTSSWRFGVHIPCQPTRIGWGYDVACQKPQRNMFVTVVSLQELNDYSLILIRLGTVEH